MDYESLLDNKSLTSHIYGSNMNVKDLKSEFRVNTLNTTSSQKDICLSSRMRGQYS